MRHPPLSRLACGQQVARLLRGAWRQEPPSPELREPEIERVLGQLEATGTVGLAWWKHRRNLAPRLSQRLEGVHQRQRLEHFQRTCQLQTIVATLQSSQIEPILAKGLSLIPLYAQPGLRPVGDFDLHVSPEQMSEAAARLACDEAAQLVDLHQGVPDLVDRDFHDLWQRCGTARFGAASVRVVPPADHLRLLCLHFIRHGGWRPLWLCDIAAFAESLPADFAWDVLEQGDPVLTAWVRAALGVAVRLLGAKLPGRQAHEKRLEGCWLDAIILAEWGSDTIGDSHSRDSVPIAQRLRQPWTLLNGLTRRIPNAVEAAFKMRVPPAQVTTPSWQQTRYCWKRACRFLQRWTSVHRPGTVRASPMQVHWAEE